MRADNERVDKVKYSWKELKIYFVIYDKNAWHNSYKNIKVANTLLIKNNNYFTYLKIKNNINNAMVKPNETFK